MKTSTTAHESLGLTELAYNLAWSQGYKHYQNHHGSRKRARVGYKPGTKLRKAFERGRGAARREYTRD